MNKESNFLDEIKATFTYRRLIILFVLILLFFGKKEVIISFIENFLLVSSSFSNVFVDILVIIFSFSLSTYFLNLIFKKYYKPSYVQLITSFAIISITIYFFVLRNELNWHFHTIKFLNVEYIWVLILPIIIFLTSYYARILFLNKRKSFREVKVENTLVQDNPITIDADDTLNYGPIVSKLYEILLSQESEKSMAIGLVGPWGNGKSSIISMVKSKLIPKQNPWVKLKNSFIRERQDEYLIIHFLPYLNHNAEDIIAEFFRGLSTALKPYNGKLSNLIIEYSNKLIDVYRKKVNISFFDSHISSFEKTSAKEMYDDINERLKETNKKIIVFVDDLDRLNGKEILQVLKLIRNSADFRNTIFLVAMDKEYVIDILTKKKEIFNSRFIDKFFQLEVYLPAIRTETLRNLFYEKLKEKSINFSDTFNRNLKGAVGDRYNLFDDYVKNIRDVKRMVNQIIYDYQFVKDAIDLKDLMNFTYFKLTFPKFVKLIIDNREELLSNPINSKLYELKVVKNPEDGKKRASYWWNNTDYNYKDLEKYEFYKDLYPEKGETTVFSKELTEKDKKLLMKTLSFLFGTDNLVSSANSIKKESNFIMLMQQRIFENHLNNDEFQELLNLTGKDLKLKIEIIFKENKLAQLIDRFDFIAPNSINEIRAVIEILAYIYDERLAYKVYDSTIFKKLATQVDDYFKNNQLDAQLKKNFTDILKLQLFENKNLTDASRLFLMTELWKERWHNSLWEIEEGYFEINALELYKNYLKTKDKNLWTVNNYDFYWIGNNLRKIDKIKEEVIDASINFWKSQEIELLCAQQVNIEAWTFKAFTIHENVIEVFGSREKFITFIKQHQDAKTEVIKEFLHFFDLSERTHFTKKILFTFKHSSLMLEKIALRKEQSSHPTTEEYKTAKQLLISTNFTPAVEILKNIRFDFDEKKHGNIEYFNNGNEYSLFMHFNNGYNENNVQDIAEVAVSVANEHSVTQDLKLNKRKFWLNDNILGDNSPFHFILISKQPKD